MPELVLPIRDGCPFVLRDVLRCDRFPYRQVASRIPDPTPQQPRPSARKLGKMDPGMGQPRIPVGRIGATCLFVISVFKLLTYVVSFLFFCSHVSVSIRLLFPFRFQVVDVQVRDHFLFTFLISFQFCFLKLSFSTKHFVF